MALVLSLILWSFSAQALYQLLKRKTPKPHTEASGISILKPVKGIDENLENNLRSFFKYKSTYAFELLFSFESIKDPAYNLVTKLCDEFKEVNSRIFILEEYKSANANLKNPKFRNLEQSFNEATYDHILISDSNVLLQVNELELLMTELTPDTGIVTAIVSGKSFTGLGGALESVFLGTFYARFMALSQLYAKPCVVGKAMLFKKSQAIRFGGLTHLSNFLAEDFMAGEAMRKLGLKVKVSSMSVTQILGKYSLQQFWSRHVRWGIIRKAHAPLAFAFEPLFSTISLSCLSAAELAHMLNTPFLSVLILVLSCFCILDGLCYLKSTDTRLKFVFIFPIIWLIREILALPLWVRILSGNAIEWRGRRLTLARGGLLSES